MHIVVIHGWEEITPELATKLAQTLDLSPYEARQRLLGGNPTVIATFAESQPAEQLATRLQQTGCQTLLYDSVAPKQIIEHHTARSFNFTPAGLQITTNTGRIAKIPYPQISLLLAATHIVPGQTETVEEKKLSLKRTALSGGIPMFKATRRKETVQDELRQGLLYLRVGRRTAFIFHQNEVNFAGHGSDRQLTSAQNIALFKQRLQQHCPQLIYDDRLFTRLGQTKLLGPRLEPEKYFALSLDLLSYCLLSTTRAS